VTRIPLTLSIAALLTVGAIAQTPAEPQPAPTPAPAAPKPAEQCRQVIDAGLQDKNPDTRIQAVVALSLSTAREPWMGLVIGMLDDKDVQVRVATVASLVDLNGPGTNKALHKALDDEVPEVSFSAARALYGLGDPAGKQALLSVLAGETKTSSGFITKQRREAIRLLHTPHTLFLVSLRAGAGFVPVPGFGMGVSSMETLLFDPTLSGRASAALLLGKEKDAATLQALKDALSDSNWSVRAAAVHSIALHDDPAQKDAVFPLLLDKAQGVRLRAAVAWLRLDAIEHAPKPPVHHKPAVRNKKKS
jgi:HEAT repeat protein